MGDVDLTYIILGSVKLSILLFRKIFSNVILEETHSFGYRKFYTWRIDPFLNESRYRLLKLFIFGFCTSYWARTIHFDRRALIGVEAYLTQGVRINKMSKNTCKTSIKKEDIIAEDHPSSSLLEILQPIRQTSCPICE